MHTATVHPAELPEPPTPRREQWLTSMTDVVRVVAWHDPTIDATPGAIATATDEFLVWFLPIIGPTGTLMAHRWATYSAAGASTWEIDDIAKTFGIGESLGRVTQTIHRLERFGMIRRNERTIAVRLWHPPLNNSLRARLPRYLAEAYPS